MCWWVLAVVAVKNIGESERHDGFCSTVHFWMFWVFTAAAANKTGFVELLCAWVRWGVSAYFHVLCFRVGDFRGEKKKKHF